MSHIYMRSLAHIFYLLHVVCCSSGRQPFYKPAMPDGDDHHGSERPAPRADHRGPRGRHGGCPPRERVTLRHDHPLVMNTITLYCQGYQLRSLASINLHEDPSRISTPFTGHHNARKNHHL
jgi:hypothetical protein